MWLSTINAYQIHTKMYNAGIECHNRLCYPYSEKGVIMDTMEKETMIRIDEQKLRELMENRGIDSMAKLAVAANVHPNTLYQYFKDQESSFDSKTLAKLATALQCQPTDLLTWDGFVTESFSPAQASL